jgi:alkylation response protein AidB-like acyl-CoA dehydrogenase
VSADLLETTLDRLLTERCGPDVRRAAEEGGFPGELWALLADSGFAFASVPEAAGGSGGNLEDAAVLCRVAGRHAVPLPLAECSLLGGWLIGVADLSLPPGPFTVAVPRQGDELVIGTYGGDWIVSGHLGWVPFGAEVQHVVAVATGEQGLRVVILETAGATVTAGRNVAGEARDTLDFARFRVRTDRVAVA